MVSLSLATLTLCSVFFLLLALGLEVAAAVGLVAALGLWLFLGRPIDQLAFAGFEVMNSFTLTAVPLFVLMGSILHNTGVVKVLFDGVDKLVRGLPGGIYHSVVVANAVFGALSGSSVAATAVFGQVCYPSMLKLGYSPKLSLGVIVTGGTLSVLIPPSVIMIIYGGWVNISVARLFAGGLIPGIILTLLLMLTIMLLVKLNPSLAPKTSPAGLMERLTALKEILPFLVLIGLVLGVIFGGVMTPTEGAAAGAFFSLILALAYRKMTFVALKDSMKTAVTVTSMMAFLIFTARVLGQVFQYLGLTETVSTFMRTLPLGKYGIFAIICIMYLVMGCFFDSFTMLVLTLPFVFPVVSQLGFNPIWFGVVYVVMAEIGLVTPPFGLNLFVLHNVIPDHDIMEIALSALPFMVPMLLLIVLVTAFPQLILWLPSVLY